MDPDLGPVCPEKLDPDPVPDQTLRGTLKKQSWCFSIHKKGNVKPKKLTSFSLF